MSRIGKKPVPIPAGVTAKLEGQSIAVKGAKGELHFTASDDVKLEIEGNLVKVSRGARRNVRKRCGARRGRASRISSSA